ncbi:DMT family transporter [Hahella sp. KA22]|uniref:DMT family transporter n=1 Tax=Hahella sp. KA22 TaxID=1628392 RepID=UPI000FDDB648|nr:DMT family transporter [Hahella sp. KA22]AZZ89872.1 DMT family transporter [Hahella sp. KA22]QAY53241.1 DMT family transporter [Hahella sp. KA22]
MIVGAYRSEAMLIVAAAIWGFAFVAQVAGMEHVGPFTFNAARFVLGGLSLIPLLIILPRLQRVAPAKPKAKGLVLGSCLAGFFLFAGASLQQVGLQYTTAGKAGFITGLYIILVPLIALCWGQRAEAKIWFGAVLCVIGLFYLSVREDFTVSYGDSLQLIGAGFWAGHVLMIGWLSPRFNPLHISIVQFLVCGLVSWVVAFAIETPTWSGLWGASWSIAYAGFMSVGIAYTLQVIGQQHAPATRVAIIISLETVFAVLGGWLMLQEVLDEKAIYGCGLMLAGMIVSQLNFNRGRTRERELLDSGASGS